MAPLRPNCQCILVIDDNNGPSLGSLFPYSCRLRDADNVNLLIASGVVTEQASH